MKKIEPRLRGEIAYVKIVEATCDICGESCMAERTGGLISSEFEGMELKAAWGYHSKKDLTAWEAQICESCVDKYLAPIINFKKSNYGVGI